MNQTKLAREFQRGDTLRMNATGQLHFVKSYNTRHDRLTVIDMHGFECSIMGETALIIVGDIKSPKKTIKNLCDILLRVP